MSMQRSIAGLAATVLFSGALYAGWSGFAVGPLEWPGAEAVIGGTWLWDLRWPLLPAYVVAALWAAERIGRLLAPGH